MAFDSVFQGPPQDVAAPGTSQSPSLGVDVVNKELYISSGQGWEELGNPTSGIGNALPTIGSLGESFILTSSVLQPAGTYYWNGIKWINQLMPNMAIAKFTLSSTPVGQNIIEPVWSDYLYNPIFSFNNGSSSAWLYTKGRGLKLQNFQFISGAIQAANPTTGNLGTGFAVGDQFSIDPTLGIGGSNALGVVTAIGVGGIVSTVSFSPQNGGNPDQFWPIQGEIAATAITGIGVGLKIDITQVGLYAYGVQAPSGSDTYLAFPDVASVQYFNMGSSRFVSADFSQMSSLILIDMTGSQLKSLFINYTNLLYPQFESNQLSSEIINSILAGCVSAGLLNGQALLGGQTPPAPPTGQGITDVLTLIGRGWDIETD